MRVLFGEFAFERQRLTRRGAIVSLTPKAALLLDALIAASPAAVSKESLYERIWHGVTVEPGNLHNLISELRAALGDDGRAAIRTVHRRGYAFTAPLRREPNRGARLEIGSGTLDLHEGETTIGRDLLGSPDVSREHARIHVDGAHVSLEDLGSKNGTFVNGKRARGRIALHEGDQIVFGRTRAVFRITDSAAPTATAPPLTGSRE